MKPSTFFLQGSKENNNSSIIVKIRGNSNELISLGYDQGAYIIRNNGQMDQLLGQRKRK